MFCTYRSQKRREWRDDHNNIPGRAEHAAEQPQHAAEQPQHAAEQQHAAQQQQCQFWIRD